MVWALGLVLLWVVFSSAVLPLESQARSLVETLALAYQSSPELLAAKASLRASGELIPQARGRGRPAVGLTARAGRCWEFDTTVPCSNRGGSLEIELTQPVYRGGRITAGIEQARIEVMAQQALLLDREQTVLYSAATAFLDVVTEQAAVELNLQNEQRFQQRRQAIRERFEIGGATVTEVSQVEQRLAGARAEVIRSRGNLAVARAAYVRVAGVPPGQLEFPELELPVPASLEAGLERAVSHHPLVRAAQLRLQAARTDVEVARGALRPSADLSLSYSQRASRWSNLDSTAGEAQIGVQVTIPLYGAGITSSEVRQARQLLDQSRWEADEVLRQTRQALTQSWHFLLAARAGVEARQAEIRAAELALEGIEREFDLGSRTLLELLDAQQELLQARIGLLRSRRDQALALLSLQMAMGSLTARQLGLQGSSDG